MKVFYQMKPEASKSVYLHKKIKEWHSKISRYTIWKKMISLL